MSIECPRVLVTGASGFVGGAVVDAFSRAGWHTHALLRSDKCPLVPWPYEWQQVHRHLWSGSNEHLHEIFNDVLPDVVVHLAAHVSGKDTADDVVCSIQSNFQFGLEVVDACVRSGVKGFLNTGSIWENGISQLDDSPVNLYAALKKAFSDVLCWYQKNYSFSCTTLVLADTYGPGDLRDKLIPSLLRSMRSNEKLLLSPGFQTVDICHVDDIAKAYVLTGRNLLNSSSSICSRYGISASKISVRELVKEFEDVCGKKLPVEWGARPYRLKEVMTPMWCNVALLPGWQVNISLRKGFSNLINACD